MSLPIGLSTVTVVAGPYTDAKGSAYRGAVTFTPSTPLVWTATGAVILPGGATATLDATGATTVTLPATDAAGLTATGFTYIVSYALTDAAGKKVTARSPYRIQVPKAVATVALENLQPFPAVGGAVTVSVPTVQSVAGLTGVVTTSGLQAALGGISSGGAVDGGVPTSVYGGTTAINGGTP